MTWPPLRGHYITHKPAMDNPRLAVIGAGYNATWQRGAWLAWPAAFGEKIEDWHNPGSRMGGSLFAHREQWEKTKDPRVPINLIG